MAGAGQERLRRLDRCPEQGRRLHHVHLGPVPCGDGAARRLDHRVHRAPAADHLESRPPPARQGDRPVLRPGPAPLALHRPRQRREGVRGRLRRRPQAPHAGDHARQGPRPQRLHRPLLLGTLRHHPRPRRLRDHYGRLRRLVLHWFPRPAVHPDRRLPQGGRPRHVPGGRGEGVPGHLLRRRLPQGLRRRSDGLRRRPGGGQPGGAGQLPPVLRRRHVPPGLLRRGRRPEDHRLLRRRGLPRRRRPGADHQGQEAHLRAHHPARRQHPLRRRIRLRPDRHRYRARPGGDRDLRGRHEQSH